MAFLAQFLLLDMSTAFLMFPLVVQDLKYSVKDVNLLYFSNMPQYFASFLPWMSYCFGWISTEISLASTKLFLQIVGHSCYEYNEAFGKGLVNSVLASVWSSVLLRAMVTFYDSCSVVLVMRISSRVSWHDRRNFLILDIPYEHRLRDAAQCYFVNALSVNCCSPIVEIGDYSFPAY